MLLLRRAHVCIARAHRKKYFVLKVLDTSISLDQVFAVSFFDVMSGTIRAGRSPELDHYRDPTSVVERDLAADSDTGSDPRLGALGSQRRQHATVAIRAPAGRGRRRARVRHARLVRLRPGWPRQPAIARRSSRNRPNRRDGARRALRHHPARRHARRVPHVRSPIQEVLTSTRSLG
jgi:hypothetical protein